MTTRDSTNDGGGGDATAGLIGLGTMGGGFARRLVGAGRAVLGYDLDPAKRDAARATGVEAAASAADVVARCDVVLLSLPSSDALVRVIETDVLPAARPGQTIVDLGTTRLPDTRRLAAALANRGAALLDAPVSGSPARGVYMFVGGDPAAFARARPVLLPLADGEHLTHAGPSGAGQVLKTVNQLCMCLVSAGYMEALGYAVRQGIDPRVVKRAVGGADGWRGELAAYAQHAVDGTLADADAKFAELPYFLDAARDAGIDLPLTAALFAFCDPGPRDWRDNMNRPYVSFWHMLTQARPK